MLKKNLSPHRNFGFTLIELVVVIVILGVLAATAAPKFIDFSSDAKIAVLHSMGGSIKSSGEMVYAKSAIQGLNNLDEAEVDLDGDATPDIQTRYGFPSGSRSNGVSKAMNPSFTTEWLWSTDYYRTKLYLTEAIPWASGSYLSGSYINETPIVATNCYLIYNRAAKPGASPKIEYITSGC